MGRLQWNKRRKVDIIENELIQTSPLIESSLETFNQNGLRVGLCKANPSGVSDSLNKLIEWIDNDPLAKPEEIVNQMVSAMGHNEQVAELVKKDLVQILSPQLRGLIKKVRLNVVRILKNLDYIFTVFWFVK